MASLQRRVTGAEGQPRGKVQATAGHPRDGAVVDGFHGWGVGEEACDQDAASARLGQVRTRQSWTQAQQPHQRHAVAVLGQLLMSGGLDCHGLSLV